MACSLKKVRPLVYGLKRSVDDKGTSHVRAKSCRTNKDLTLHECHDPPWAEHPGWHRTLALLESIYSH